MECTMWNVFVQRKQYQRGITEEEQQGLEIKDNVTQVSWIP